jgi:spermidine/putrescine transport system permease protein
MKKKHHGFLGLFIPTSLWSFIFIVSPIFMFILYSFWRVKDGFLVKEASFVNYIRIFTNYIYPTLIWKSLVIAFGVTAITFVMGYPLALFISRQRGKLKAILYMLIVIPLLTSYIVRIYAMRLILGSSGLINMFLLNLNIIKEPLQFLLFNRFAIFITLCVILSPFMVMPIFTSLEKIPRSYIEASKDLGASDFSTFWKVIFPLSIPGVIAGVLFIFVLSIGDFLTPILVGGTQGITISKVIQINFGFAYNWPLGSALSTLLLSFSIVLILVGSKFGALREI